MSTIRRMPWATFVLDRRSKFYRDRAHWERAGKPENVILIEPPDEVICDFCNAEILGPSVALLVSGERITHALCEDCVLRVDAERSNERNENEHRY